MHFSFPVFSSPAPRRAALGLAAAAIVALSGCASVKPQGPSTSNAATAVTAQTSRAYHGRFAVQYVDQNGQQRNAYGNFDWQERGDTVTLQLRNPLGQTMAIVTSSPSAATLELPNRQPLTADNVSTLMQNALGFALPVEGLRYWLQPSVAPTSKATTEKDPQQETRLKEIQQDGWTIDYIAYADAPAAGVKRVNLARTEPPLDIKLVLDQ
ncbi:MULTISPECIES: lipoprotein insertase outer membrane protein LolB [Paraburkholderia]|jgi:outer membrane lipoprotein LolB|uniref:Outer-membrane lipoprotein LolB n=1 Tax=Paraburkholderia caribensis TaxID=75105 RepID=A0A9Q6RZU2_9BURK|nr:MULTISPECIES: lipoprotein insertase outer membrane protein LolB [Paraburkholderia]ALP61171.1 outer membrane lipoprotein LolB [Paraburkholderia caribensis]AMV41412.1 outer membrane lipoprotein LolB [Paraburkholderia caribensis]AUT50705.1 lipoprotein localization protein LolB [Paraburkholderia caribensis]MCO4875503.1 lipoprotein insertase outer membrane protein LolB [Paraburkholderia caribensis]MDR6379842.1 outer membrane lipoprotein LolB [Paraburkholderia caribensis]